MTQADGARNQQALAQRERAELDVDVAPIDRFQLLDVYAKGVVTEPGGGARIDALATISAGERGPEQNGRPGNPKVSRDGTIFLHDADGRAPGLKAALEAGGNKKLTIAVGFDDPELFLQQRFTSYTATALKVYGDQYRLMEIVYQGEPGKAKVQHVVHNAGEPRYLELLEQCKVAASLYFVLADWDEDNHARVLMPDGLGFYRLRTTSRHSLRNILGTLQYLSRFTGGRLAGVPLELQLAYPEVADPWGIKRRIPRWSLAMKPPHGIQLSTRNFAPMVQQALKEGQALHVPTPESNGKMLMAPRAETWETAAAEGPIDVEPDDADLARLMAGEAPADEDYWRKRWFGTVRGSRFATDEGRAEWMAEYTDGETDSLAEWLKDVTNAEAEKMILTLTDRLASSAGQQQTAARARRYEEIFGDDDGEVRKNAVAVAEQEEDDIDPGDMGEGGWAEAAQRDQQPEEPEIDPDVGECELCGVITKLQLDDEGALICVDREACSARTRAVVDAQTWLEELRHQISDHPNTKLADYERRKAIGMLIQRVTDNDAAASRELLKLLVGTTSLAKLTEGACEVIEAQASKPEWSARVKLVLPRAEPAAT